MVQSHNCFPFTPILHLSWNFTETSQRLPWVEDVPYWFFWVQRSRSYCIDNWKWFMLHNCFFTPITMRLHTKTRHESRMCPIDLGVQRSRSHCVDNWKCCILIAFLLSWNFIHWLSMSPGCALWFWGQNVKVTMLWLLKMVNVTYPHTLDTKNPHESSMCPIDFGVKRPKVTMHWLLKFNTETPHESSMCSIDFGVKRSLHW